MDKLKCQALQKFNLQASKFISAIRCLVVKDIESAKDYNIFETVVNNIIIPADPELILSMFKKLIYDNTDYRKHINNKDDSLFTNEKIFADYKKIFDKLLEDNTQKKTSMIANILIKEIANKNTKIVGKYVDSNGKFDIAKVDCDELMTENKDKIKNKVDEYRTKWESLPGPKKTDMWNILNIMVYLIGKYF